MQTHKVKYPVQFIKCVCAQHVYSKLEVKLPKFKMEHSYSLHEILPDMGMASVFDDSANLTKLSKDKGIKVSEVSAYFAKLLHTVS